MAFDENHDDYDRGKSPWMMCPYCQKQSNYNDYQKYGCPHCGAHTKEWEEKRRKKKKEQDKRLKKAMVKMKADEMKKAKEKAPDHAFMLPLNYISAIGRQGWTVICSECNEEFRLYEWSFRGNGSKKCPGCGYKHHNLYAERDGEPITGYRAMPYTREEEKNLK